MIELGAVPARSPPKAHLATGATAVL